MPAGDLIETESFRAPKASFSVFSEAEEYPDNARSIEQPRRTSSERPLLRLSRGSLEIFFLNDHMNNTSEIENFATYGQYKNSNDIIDQVEDRTEDDNLDEASDLG